jgi:predicted DNA-binding transcriptional regulator YafY
MVHDAYSIFKYNLRITPDFVEELLSHGPRVVVVSPPELRAMVMNELEASIRNYKEQEQ